MLKIKKKISREFPRDFFIRLTFAEDFLYL